MKELEFLKCEECGKIIFHFKGDKVKTCHGKPMIALVANTVDAAVEKHKPVVIVDGNKVEIRVGETLHPMIAEHYIEFVVMETDRDFETHEFKPGDAPIAYFTLAGDKKFVKAYAYCNLHGLWS